MLIWHHGCIDRFSHKGSIYGSVTFLMVEINYSQVRIKVDTRSGRWAVATVGGSINSPNKQNTKQSCSGSITEIAGFLKKEEKKKEEEEKI